MVRSQILRVSRFITRVKSSSSTSNSAEAVGRIEGARAIEIPESSARHQYSFFDDLVEEFSNRQLPRHTRFLTLAPDLSSGATHNYETSIRT